MTLAIDIPATSGQDRTHGVLALSFACSEKPLGRPAA